MKTKKILVVGNWKMNPATVAEAKTIWRETKAVVKDLQQTTVVICPPFVYLSALEKMSGGQAADTLVLGAQDMFWEKSGAFTGEISPGMLKGESYVILGHSERRALGETDEMVAKKVLAAAKAGLRPIVCVGEKSRDGQGEYLHFLRTQIIQSLGKLPKRFLEKLVIAYEPVWAIGQSEAAAMQPTDIHETSLFIKKILTELYELKAALLVPILYGGSVGADNAKATVTAGEVQGLLVGRESLQPKKFGDLLKNVD